MTKKQIYIGIGLVVAALGGYYLYNKNQQALLQQQPKEEAPQGGGGGGGGSIGAGSPIESPKEKLLQANLGGLKPIRLSSASTLDNLIPASGITANIGDSSGRFVPQIKPSTPMIVKSNAVASRGIVSAR